MQSSWLSVAEKILRLSNMGPWGHTYFRVTLFRVDVDVVARMRSDVGLTLPSLRRGGSRTASARVTIRPTPWTPARPTPRCYPSAIVWQILDSSQSRIIETRRTLVHKSVKITRSIMKAADIVVTGYMVAPLVVRPVIASSPRRGSTLTA